MDVRATLQRYAKAVGAAPTLDAAIDVVSQTATEFGFAGATSVFWPRAKDTGGELAPPSVHMTGSHIRAMAASWRANYLKRELFKSDFVYRACRVTSMPVVWSYDSRPEIVLRVGQTATGRELMSIEQMVTLTGMRGGISVPIRGPGAFLGYVAFASSDRLETLLSQHEEYGDYLFAIAYRFYDTMIDKLAVHAAQGPRLSARELECMSLLAIGKTLDEAATILGLSYSTVRFHLQNAERKLGTRNRSHAIARAAFLGLLGPLD